MDFLYFSGCFMIPFYDDVCVDDGDDARVD